ncbi:hypothetical protein [Streptomyces thermoalcalitolerans]|uniref:Uncharacterized protein n=1 Tax=Streptomyces thermoalcalitolerans TaxID=65605 RepID=A0ABP3Z1D4_9ACTN
MNRTEREAAVRRLLEQPSPQVPVELYDDAVRRGERMLRRRTAARRAMWLVLFAATVALTVWALTARPWAEPPPMTPPVADW